jgi:excisionase family DNA binding protein
MNLGNSNKDRLLTIKEVSELTGLATGSLYHFVSERRIPVVRFSSRCIRFQRSALEQWFEELSQYPEGTINDKKTKPLTREKKA